MEDKKQSSAEAEAEKAEFLSYVNHDNITQVDLMLQKNPALANSLNKYGYSPLMQAITFDHVEIVKILLKYNCDTSFQNKFYKWNGLMLAIFHNHIEIVKLLLNYGTTKSVIQQLQAKNFVGQTSMTFAYNTKDLMLINLLENFINMFFSIEKIKLKWKILTIQRRWREKFYNPKKLYFFEKSAAKAD